MARVMVDVPRQPAPVNRYMRMLMVNPDDTSELKRVTKDWAQSYRRNKKELPQKVYHLHMEKLVGALALTSRLEVLVSDDLPPGENILGWICWRPRMPEDPALVVHYCYVRKCYRGQKLHEDLLKRAGWRGPGDIIIGSHPWNAPQWLRRKYNVFYNDFYVKAGQV